MKNKKSILILPYLIIILFTPMYLLLDRAFLVKIFGCGCVPIAQTNMFNIAFNANDLKVVVYSILAIAITIFGGFLSKKIGNKFVRILYIISVFLVNIFLVYEVCSIWQWG